MKALWGGVFVLLLALSMPVVASEDNPDPWEAVNRVTHGFNDVVDKILLKPLAKGYQRLVPHLVRQGIGNFFSNLSDINNAANNMLQGKFHDGVSDIGRLALNTTVGLGGLLDPASSVGLTQHNEDLGQTLQVWGVPKGPYLVLPLLGPSTVTDFLSRPLESQLDPMLYYRPTRDRNWLLATNLVDARARFLSAESMVFGDRYVFFKNAYLQRREFLTKDGQVKDEFDDF